MTFQAISNKDLTITEGAELLNVPRHMVKHRYQDIRRADPSCNKCGYVSSSKSDMARHLGEKHSAAQIGAQLGVIKMSDYLNKGTRQQFWEENFVKGVMQV